MPFCGTPIDGSLWSSWNIPLLILVLALAGWYWLAWHRRQDSGSAGEGSGEVGRKVSFYSGLALFYLAAGSPVDYIGHMYLFSVHMTAMAVEYMVVPPLVLLGLPEWMVQPWMRVRGVQRLVRAVSRPLFALTTLNLLFTAYHFPSVFDYLMSHGSVALWVHGVMMIAAFINWLPVIQPFSGVKRLSELQKIIYLFVDAVLLTPACAFIIFSNGPLYVAYDAMPRLIPSLSIYVDQQLGGIVMKLTQEAAYIGAIVYIFVQWTRREKELDRRDKKGQLVFFPVDKDGVHGANTW
ncbi:MAG: cytochrome c oxidase assembly protein [Kyrpidia tusciae]|nr:cytochrome c oxidase assembly protein [Kyrpidia tusciae]MBE3553250.1 cytochrome c oxidase assembly protein [Kyrpidia tusciae]